MTTDTAPTPTVHPIAHRARPELPLWIRATRPLLLAAITIATGLVVTCLGLFVVAVLGAAIAGLTR